MQKTSIGGTGWKLCLHFVEKNEGFVGERWVCITTMTFADKRRVERDFWVGAVESNKQGLLCKLASKQRPACNINKNTRNTTHVSRSNKSSQLVLQLNVMLQVLTRVNDYMIFKCLGFVYVAVLRCENLRVTSLSKPPPPDAMTTTLSHKNNNNNMLFTSLSPKQWRHRFEVIIWNSKLRGFVAGKRIAVAVDISRETNPVLSDGSCLRHTRTNSNAAHIRRLTRRS